MTERLKNTTSKKEKLLKGVALMGIATAALAGCKAEGEAPTAPSSEVTQTQDVTPTEVDPDTTTPEAPETTEASVNDTVFEPFEVKEFSLKNSEIYRTMDSDSREMVDAAMAADLDEYKMMDPIDRSVFVLAALDAGSKDYIDFISNATAPYELSGGTVAERMFGAFVDHERDPSADPVDVAQGIYDSVLKFNPTEFVDKIKEEYPNGFAQGDHTLYPTVHGFAVEDGAPAYRMRLIEGVALMQAAEGHHEITEKLVYGMFADANYSYADELLAEIRELAMDGVTDELCQHIIDRFPVLSTDSVDLYSHSTSMGPNVVKLGFNPEGEKEYGAGGWSYTFPRDDYAVKAQHNGKDVVLRTVYMDGHDPINPMVPYF